MTVALTAPTHPERPHSLPIKPHLLCVLQKGAESTTSLLNGNIVHELFQEALRLNRYDTKFLEETARKIISQNLEEM